MSADKLTSILGFAVKGRKLIYGLDNIEAYKGKIYGIYYDGGLSEKSLKNLTFWAEKKKAGLIKCETPIEVLTGKKNCKCVGLIDGNMFKGIMTDK